MEEEEDISKKLSKAAEILENKKSGPEEITKALNDMGDEIIKEAMGSESKFDFTLKEYVKPVFGMLSHDEGRIRKLARDVIEIFFFHYWELAGDLELGYIKKLLSEKKEDQNDPSMQSKTINALTYIAAQNRNWEKIFDPMNINHLKIMRRVKEKIEKL